MYEKYKGKCGLGSLYICEGWSIWKRGCYKNIQPKVGNAPFNCRVDFYNWKNSNEVVNDSADWKAVVIEAAVYASAVENLPPSFRDNKKWMNRFAKALYKAGQPHSSSETINIENLILCGKRTRSEVISLAKKWRKNSGSRC